MELRGWGCIITEKVERWKLELGDGRWVAVGLMAEYMDSFVFGGSDLTWLRVSVSIRRFIPFMNISRWKWFPAMIQNVKWYMGCFLPVRAMSSCPLAREEIHDRRDKTP